MSGDARSIEDVVQRLRSLTMADRTRELQRLIGTTTTNVDLLDWRAQLVTALRVAELWPAQRPS